MDFQAGLRCLGVVGPGGYEFMMMRMFVWWKNYLGNMDGRLGSCCLIW